MQAVDLVHTPLTRFLSAYEALLEDYYRKMGYKDKIADIGLTKGQKYQRLTRDGSAVAFIDEAGDIYMAGSWSRPAKHVRGNIHSELHGMEAFGATGHVRYLK